MQKIGHHLRGHFARIGADTAIGDAVIGDEYDADRCTNANIERFLNGANLRRERSKPLFLPLPLTVQDRAAVSNVWSAHLKTMQLLL